MPHLITTLGPIAAADLGMILPHEHIFVDLRTWDQPGYGEADAAEVIRLMAPEIERVRAAGITAIVEPGPIGVGRRADILLAVSEATQFPLVIPTGIYRELWMPPWVHAASEEDLRDWMIAELTEGVEQTGVRVGWIKVGATDDGVTEAEARVLRAATRASIATRATIGSHTVRGTVARSQLDIIERAGGSADRFVWIHAHNEPDLSIHDELARRGLWLEYDGIGAPEEDDRFVALVRHALDAGLKGQVLLSQDRGWFDPAQPGGGTPLPFTALPERFLPRLAAEGIDAETISLLMRDNPFRAFAR
jgi:phosphotriesterase-related protein